MRLLSAGTSTKGYLIQFFNHRSVSLWVLDMQVRIWLCNLYSSRGSKINLALWGKMFIAWFKFVVNPGWRLKSGVGIAYVSSNILNFWRIYIHPWCHPQGRQLNYESITITNSSLVGWTWISSFPSVTNLMTSCFRNTNHSVLYFRHLASCCTATTTRSSHECLLGATEY